MSNLTKLLGKIFGGVQKSVDEAWVVRMIAGIFIAVLLLNVAAIVVYVNEKSWSDYFDSKSYEALLAVLLVPLLLAFVDRAFKVNERLRQEERARKIQTIEKTNAMWSELYTLSTEVAFFKDGHGQMAVRDVRRKLECFTNSAEECLNLWYLNFPEIEKEVLEVESLALPGLNLLLLSAMTVADVVEAREPDAKDMQNCLLVIQDGVRTGLHYSLMQVFYFAMEDKPAARQRQLNYLRGWGKFFKELIKNVPPNLPPGTDTDGLMKQRHAFQTAMENFSRAKSACDKFDDQIRQASDDAVRNKIRASAEFKAAEAAHDAAVQSANDLATGSENFILQFPPARLGIARKRFFSKEQIREFTRRMFFQNDRILIQTAA